jgi:hypothetical protein
MLWAQRFSHQAATLDSAADPASAVDRDVAACRIN